jgi:TolA-binding protein
MNEKSRNINGKKQQQRINTWADTVMLLRPEDLVLLNRISDYFRGSQDIEDVKSDPDYNVTNKSVAEMISVFKPEAFQNKANAKFIRESVAMENEEEKLTDEINDIKGESIENDIGKITIEWVREWDEKQHKSVSTDAESKERKEFITNSLEKAENESENVPATGNSKILKKTFFARFALPAAAAVVGALFLIKSLLPSHDPDTLFAKYYEPISAISPITRSANTDEMNIYTSAIESYNKKNYQAAATGFSDALLQNPSNISCQFFMGITHIALGNYDQAENILEGVINSQGEYVKEARWYLGLAYIKTGNIEKASGCFEILAQSPGFYSERAEKILRRLR